MRAARGDLVIAEVLFERLEVASTLWYIMVVKVTVGKE